MQLLPWLLTWFIWRAMGDMVIQRFFVPQNQNMKITSPTQQMIVEYELQCAMLCMQNSTCLSFSVTQASGTLICSFGYKYNQPRTTDVSSKFFYREATIPAGYNLVPGTNCYVKLVGGQSINQANAALACKNEGSELVSSNNALVNNYIKQQWASVPAGQYYWVGGLSVADMYHWTFPDGTNVSVDGQGQSYFCSVEPDGYAGDNCIWVWNYDTGIACWNDRWCTDPANGYICEIKLPQ
ncbi:unnamed protein product [Darwinula stevensoni]|uniref:C-type lectin domain-containing protein n=1 Tax=Darwinula stevensoni TaxID=69355 RepID=A0A7R9FPI6_9CRUS|nr:unnamed protein product [Darwinula stevensoni]CAG0898000.1 unnamed protein product [Darwinula stevensoni]